MRHFIFCLLSAAALTAAAGYNRKVPQTLVFSRAQWHYTPELDYYGRWLDRPLLLDPEMLDYNTQIKHIALNAKSYNLAGLASLYGKNTGKLIRALEQAKIPGFVLLPEIYSTGGNMYEPNKALKPAKAAFDQVFLPALKSNVTLKINGKTVISSYCADRRPAAFWHDVLELYRKQCGDKFIFLPQLAMPHGKPWYHWRNVWAASPGDPATRNAIKQHYRDFLRATDGVYLDCAPTVSSDDRHTDMKFYQFMIDTAVEVLAEPEFKNKYFAIAARLGHKNGTRVGYIRGSYGTWCYRGTLGRALKAKPDIIIIPEWDEQNENTSLRPTVFNHSTFTRLTRVMTGKSATLPGDDTSVPNLIMSYRKVIALGENPEYELLSLPGENGACEARFLLRSSNGRQLYVSPWKRFSGKAMEEFRTNVDSRNWNRDDFALVEVETRQNGKVRRFGNMQYIRIEPVNNFDYKYVKQPLRDLMDVQVKENFTPEGELQVQVDSKTPVDWAEVMENGVEIYTHCAAGRPYLMESADRKFFSIRAQAIRNPVFLNGSMSVENASSLWYGSEVPADMGKPGKVTIKRVRQSLQMKRWLVSVPAAEVDNAVLNIDLPGFFTGKIKLADVLKNGVFGIPSEGLAVFTVLRQDFQSERPLKLRRKSFKFTAPEYRYNPGALYNIQLIDANGKSWRSTPFRRTPVSRDIRRVKVWSEKLNKPVTVTLPGSSVPVIEYRPDAKYGTAMVTPAGRKYYGIAGGFASLVSGLYGAYRDSTGYITVTHFPSNAKKISVPVVNGAWELGAPGSVLQLPTGVISRRAAFRLTIELCQRDPAGVQTLADTRSSNIGLFYLISRDGVLELMTRDRNGNSKVYRTGLALPKGKWTTVIFDFDLNTLSVSVDGKTFRGKAQGYGVFDTAVCIGGGPLGAFKGGIRRINVDYRR